MTLRLEDDFGQHEMWRGVERLEDEVGSGRDGDHFVALHGHVDAIPERRVDAAEEEETKANTVALVFLGEGLDESGHTELARDVGRGIFHHGFAENARKGDEESVFLRGHDFARGLRDEEGAAQVGVHDLAELGVGCIGGRFDQSDPGAMDDAIDPTH